MSPFRKQLCCVLIFAQFATLPATYVLQRSLHGSDGEMLPGGSTQVLTRRTCCPLCFCEQPANENNHKQPAESDACLICKAAFTVSRNDFYSLELQLPDAVGEAPQAIVTLPFCIAMHRWYGRGPPGWIG